MKQGLFDSSVQLSSLLPAAQVVPIVTTPVVVQAEDFFDERSVAMQQQSVKQQKQLCYRAIAVGVLQHQNNVLQQGLVALRRKLHRMDTQHRQLHDRMQHEHQASLDQHKTIRDELTARLHAVVQFGNQASRAHSMLAGRLDVTTMNFCGAARYTAQLERDLVAA